MHAKDETIYTTSLRISVLLLVLDVIHLGTVNIRAARPTTSFLYRTKAAETWEQNSATYWISIYLPSSDYCKWKALFICIYLYIQSSD